MSVGSLVEESRTLMTCSGHQVYLVCVSHVSHVSHVYVMSEAFKNRELNLN